MSDKIGPLFAWTGGKGKMIKRYGPYFPDAGEYDTYVEPFFGGGAIFLHLKSTRPNLRCYINDVNPDIMRIYGCVKNNLIDFTKKLNDLEDQFLPLKHEDRRKFYYALREEHAWDYSKWNMVEETAVLYFLMKTGYMGNWQINKNTNNRFGAACGMCDQKDGVYDRKNINAWSAYLQDTELSVGNWKDCVDKVEPDRAFFMFDPPYRGGFVHYHQTFTDDDQIALLDSCSNIQKNGGKVFFANRELDDGFWHNHEAGLKKDGLDIVWFDVIYTHGALSLIHI